MSKLANCSVNDAFTGSHKVQPPTDRLFYRKIGYPNIDINGPRQYGFAIPQSTTRRGARCSSAKAFLGEARGRSNLHVIVHAFATKILFNQYKEAIGVVFERFGVPHKAFARKEIIISAGTINTPQLLMLSGEQFVRIVFV